MPSTWSHRNRPSRRDRSIEILESQAEFAHVLHSGQGAHRTAGRRTPRDRSPTRIRTTSGLPGLLTPAQTAALLATRDSDLRRRVQAAADTQCLRCAGCGGLGVAGGGGAAPGGQPVGRQGGRPDRCGAREGAFPVATRGARPGVRRCRSGRAGGPSGPPAQPAVAQLSGLLHCADFSRWPAPSRSRSARGSPPPGTGTSPAAPARTG